MRYRLGISNWTAPRWEAMGATEASALVGYAFADRKHFEAGSPTEAAFAAARLVQALFCAGAPFEDLGRAAHDYVAIVIRGAPAESDANLAPLAVRLADATRAFFLTEQERSLGAQLCREVVTCQKRWSPAHEVHRDIQDELTLYAAALGDAEADERLHRSMGTGGFMPAVRAHDAAAFAALTVETIRGCVERAERSRVRDATHLLSRVQGYTDFGHGVFYGAMRAVGKAVGLSGQPPPPEDLSRFFWP